MTGKSGRLAVITSVAALLALAAAPIAAPGRNSAAAEASSATQAGGAAPSPDAASACAVLSGRTIGGVALSTTLVPARADAPIYCKVNGALAPGFNFEMRLPEHWNGKLYYGGGGGYDGVMPPLALPALQQGYAQIVSNGGHIDDGDGMSASFIENNPRAAELFGGVSVPTAMAAALQIVTATYGAPPTRAYFEGCSTGGREALMVVQRYPDLFDGVIARAPAFNWVGYMGQFNAVSRALAAPGGAFSPAKTALLARHVREACDSLDGIRDGIVANRAACTARVINIAALRCAGGADRGDNCLSDAQLSVVRTWTSDVSYAHGAYHGRGYALTGNEDDPMNFGIWASGNGDVRMAGQYMMQDSTVKYYLAHDANVDSLKYTPWDRDRAAIDHMAALNDATDPDIRPFIRRGGRLIVWQGGSDAALSVNSTAAYMSDMRRRVGSANADAATRFYVAPGVNHCEGGPGADHADLLSALDLWVTTQMAPHTLLATKRDARGATAFSRPLCVYPNYPHYVGPPHDAEAARSASNYACRAPERSRS